MPIVETYYIAKATSTSEGKNKFNFISNTEKVSETVFFDLLKSNLKELVGQERMDKYEELLVEVTAALKSKKPVTIGSRNFEIKVKKTKD